MRRNTLALATWMLSRLAPEEQRESLVGDLLEEYALRTASSSSSAALKWYVRQVCASAVHLLWTGFKRAAWISTVGVALLCIVAVGVVDFIFKFEITHSRAIGVIVNFAAVVLIAYFAARLRRGAPAVFGTILLISFLAMPLASGERLPFWYRASYLLMGPVAAYIGSALQKRQKRL